MSAWADYVEWSGLDDAKLRHPAGKGIPVSDEVRWEWQTAQALEVANHRRALEDAKATLRSYGWVDEKHHELSTGPCPMWVRVAGQVAAIIGLVVVVCGFAFLGDPGAGWPL